MATTVCLRESLLPAALLTLASWAVATPAAADAFTISTSLNQLQPGVDNQGWVSDSISNSNATNDNYFTGAGDDYRSYFFFDVSGVTAPILSAQLDLTRYDSTAGATIEFFSVATPVFALVATRGDVAPSPAIYTDLGTGTSYGSFTIGAGSASDLLSFKLNAAVLADLNAATGYFTIGARVADGTMFSDSLLEPGNTGGKFNMTQQLVIETAPVPEPGSVLLVGTGLAAAGLRRWRKKRV